MKIVFRLLASLFCLVGLKLNAGNLKVNLAPSQAVSAGAQWRVDGGTWRSSGATVSGLSNANHTVDFSMVSGWIAPAAISVAVVSGTTTLTGTYVQTAALKITLTPSSGQWRIDSGTWRTSGTTVTGLAPGNHTVDYASVAGYAAPAAETVALTAGQTTTLARSYVQLAQLKITLSPTSGQWQVDGGAWQASGATVANLAVGSHTIAYAALSGYASPASESVTLTSGQLLTLNRSYVQLAQLTMTLAPSSAQWRVDGGTWRASGTLVANLAVGAHTVDYAPLSGYNAPASESVSLSSGQSLTLNRSYVQLAQVTVTLTPASAQWRVDGGTWRASGTTAANLAIGTHTIDYAAFSGYTAPESESISLSSGQSLTLNRSYVQLAQVIVTLTPASAQWRIDGGAWRASGTIAANLAIGTHTIDYAALSGYTAPAPESVSLASGQSLTLNRSYIQLAQITVTLSPAAGQWRVDGGVWQASGATVSNLAPGNHALEYTAFTEYVSPAPETVALAAGQSLSLSRSYTAKAQISITLVPSSGQWRIPGGAWNASDASVLVAPGTYSLEFAPLEFYDLPALAPITLVAGGGFSGPVAYQSTKPTLQVQLVPNMGQWRVDGGAWQPSGAVVGFLDEGSHTVDYLDLGGGYNPLPSETIPLSLRQHGSLWKEYPVKPATATVTLTPGSATWRIFPGTTSFGAWQNSGASVAGLAPGSYTIEYAPVSNYAAPASEAVTLIPTQLLTITRDYTQLASLNVVLTPSSAQWRLDAGAWQSSSTTLNDLSLGSHTLEYSAASGYLTPAPETVTLVGGANSLPRSYAPLASFNVALSPSSAQWRLDGGTWQTTSTTLNNLSLGTHTVDFASFSGYIAPPSETVTLVSGANSIMRSYTQLASFNVSLNLSGAQWRLDGGSWQFASATLNNLSLGDHLVEFIDVLGYITPAPVTVTLVSGTNLTLTRSYTQLASLNVSLNLSGAQWRLDGGSWQFTSATLNNLSLGDHLVEFIDVFGYITPAPVTVTLVSGTNSLIRAYTPLPASMTVALTPAEAQWRVDGGAWLASGATANGLAPSDHVIEYSDVTGYITPAPHTVTLMAGVTTSFSYTYAPSVPLFATITTFPDAGNGATFIRGSEGVYYVATLAGGGNGGGEIFRINLDGSGYAPIKAFRSGNNVSTGPVALTEASDHVLYGTTTSGGVVTNAGTVFRINKDGTGFAILYSFASADYGSSLIEGSDGYLYGTTNLGSISNTGLIFRMNKDGTGYTVMSAGYGARGLVEGPGGLYATTPNSNLNGLPCIFRCSFAGSITVLHQFTGGASDGSSPKAVLLRASDGMFYGTTQTGGTANKGVVYRMNFDGTGFVVLRSFLGGTDGSRLDAALSEGPDGMLYGATFSGGTSNRGTVFRMNKDGSGYAILRSLLGNVTEGGLPNQRVVIDPNGILVGATTFSGGDAFGTLFKMNSDGTAFTPLRQFGAPLGANPNFVIEGSDGALYGGTYNGGGGRGALFKVNKDGTGYTFLHGFNSTSGGEIPLGRLIESNDGLLYGTTISGVPNSIVFRMNKDGTGFTSVHDFSASTDGSLPYGGVAQCSDGLLYGTTAAGGTQGGYGTVYRLNKDGTGYVTLRSFANGSAEGNTPTGALIEGPGGKLYGAHWSGGTANAGTIFSMAKDGTGYTVLHQFAGGTTDGSAPYGTLFLASDGRLYGTTSTGGTSAKGTVFGLNADGSGYAILKNFAGSSDGASPQFGSLVEKDGALFGTTTNGGLFDNGTLYKINKDGTGFTILVNFGVSPDDGRLPTSGVIKASDGRFYGTTYSGTNGGTVFFLQIN